MITEMTYARQMLSIGGYKLVVCAKDSVHVSEESGLASLLSLVGEDTWIGAAAADKVVGKAAAMLFVLLRVKSLYAEVITETAKAVLEAQGIECVYGTLVERLIDADGKVCPSELAVENVVDPSDAPAALK
ncbi:MAG: DUF1893 domain-containing protein [Ruminococcus sp.]|nr:DUF1893 domain-containing protein [Ruminococcus sp.]